jgi:hypothetical protein
MEVLDAMFRRADEWGMFQPLGLRSLQHRACLYADDLVLLICLRQQDLLTLWQILEIFQGASRLGYNLDNCQMASIRCMDDQWQLVASLFPCQQVEFPITYLGIPLSMGKLQRVVWQRLIDKVADKLSTWKGALMHRAGMLALIKWLWRSDTSQPWANLPIKEDRLTTAFFKPPFVVRLGMDVPNGSGQTPGYKVARWKAWRLICSQLC